MLNRKRTRKHNIDLMFLIVLFMIFTFSALSVLIMAINSYRSVVYANEDNNVRRTAGAYIREKIRSHDVNGEVSVSSIDGIKAIVMPENEDYSLYIYYLDGYLMELEAQNNAGVTADFGNKIIEIKDFEIEKKNSNLIELTIIDKNGLVQTVDVAVKSSEDIPPEDNVQIITEEVVVDED